MIIEDARITSDSEKPKVLNGLNKRYALRPPSKRCEPIILLENSSAQRGRTARRLAVVLHLALVVSACGEEPSDPVSFVDGPIIVDAEPDDGGTDAGAGGTIGLVDGCLIMFEDHESSDDPIGVEWPPGTTWDDAANAVVLPDGRVVNIGDFIVGGGGGHGLDDEFRVTPEVRAALEECGIDSVWAFTGEILTGAAAIDVAND